MKLVTFDRAMAPFQPGETRLVPDDVAQSLQAEGFVREMSDFPASTTATPEPPAKPKLSLPGRRDRQSYLTK